jgi:hypothetical protein
MSDLMKTAQLDAIWRGKEIAKFLLTLEEFARLRGEKPSELAGFRSWDGFETRHYFDGIPLEIEGFDDEDDNS